jgi:hypothetical protein
MLLQALADACGAAPVSGGQTGRLTGACGRSTRCSSIAAHLADPGKSHHPERAMQTHATRLVYEIDDALKCSPLPPEKYASFERQTRQVPGNLNRALWKLARLRRLAESIDYEYDKEGQQHQELEAMTKRLHGEMRHSLELVSSLSISLVKVELAHDDLSSDRLLADLNDSNQRLRDLSASYAEVKEQRERFSMVGEAYEDSGDRT